ncbi:MAG: hypothetical protein N2109_12925 [Fimbriimonadales bacterium]|nr:hypothetical protein [Fimbriimonadales bacterium]
MGSAAGGWRLLLAVWALAAAPLALSQRVPYCNVTGVQAKRLANGVELTIQADGILDVELDFGHYINLEAISMSRWDEFAKFVTYLPFRIRNARSRIGNVVDVGQYPISHVETSVLPESTDGVGLDLRVVLFEPAFTIAIKTPQADPDFWNRYPDRPSVRIQIPPDQRRILIVVSTNRRVQLEQERVPPPEGASSTLTIARRGALYDIDCVNAPLADFARRFTEASGRSVLVESGLRRWITAFLSEATFDEVLGAIGAAYGLSVEFRGPHTVLADAMVRSRQAHLSGQMEPVALRSVAPEVARAALPDFLLRCTTIDSDHNALLVSGSRELIDRVRRDIALVDRPAPMLLFEVTAIETGGDWEGESLAELLVGQGQSELVAKPAVGDFAVVQDLGGRDRLQARLQALETSQRARIRARTAVVAKAGEEARLFAGSQRLAKYEFVDQLSNQITARIIPVDLGAGLVARGFASSDQVLLTLEPSVTSIGSVEPGTGLPTVVRRSASATLVLPDGGSLVVGGLRDERRDRSTVRVPLLSELPLLGGWFRFPRTKTVSSELAFVVTVRILRPEEASAKP